MKKITILLLILLVSKISPAQLKPVEQGSTLTFNIKNLGFGVKGSFKGFEGNINFDPQNAEGSNFDVTVNSSTVNTDNNLRDEHLRGEGYFDVKNHPNIRLVSTKIAEKNGSYMFTGVLIIKGKSQNINFPFTATPFADGYLFKGVFKIKRKDFGVGGTSTVSDELEVTLNVIAKK
ncbi:MAG: YceI family protein [Mucilaginibacter sp.]|uniref:YceI family protein n=1 Tax=Mucilaginibacter sp. TaxID=1882438 RepID=UPI003265BA53